jgi:hypothetical protein
MQFTPSSAMAAKQFDTSKLQAYGNAAAGQ